MAQTREVIAWLVAWLIAWLKDGMPDAGEEQSR